MDIDGVYYCSRCMRKLDQEEQSCPHCGYDAASAQVSSQHLEEGTFLNDRYLLGAVIGAGGFGVTYAAWDENLSVPVAIKEYFPVKYAHRNVAESDEILPHEEGRAPFALGLSRFRREAQVLAQFQNVPGIVNINECFDENGTAYIAMEFVHGVPLDVYVRERKPTPRKLLEIMLPAINALETIHRQGVNHRDVKPENLLVQEDGSIKLIDFGSAREVEHVTNLIIVSDGYAALEQYDPRQPQGPFVDVYGVSATIYHMLTGVMPDAAISRAKHDKLKKPTRLGVRLKKYQEDALMAGLAVDPQKRIQSIAEFRSRLYNMPLPEEVRRRKAFVRRVIAVAVLTLLLMAAAFVNFAIGFPLGEGLIYSLYPDGWHVVGVAEEQAEVTVPADRLGLPVTVIGKDSFKGHQTLKHLVIPGCVKKIAPYSFYNCTNLTMVTLEDGVEVIGDSAFAYCSSLMIINMSSTVVSINNNAFAYCPTLTNLLLPISISKIGDHAFTHSNLHTIHIPSNVTAIGDCAFSNCDNLESVYFNFIAPSCLKTIGGAAFSECSSLQSITIPDSVISIGDEAFSGCAALRDIKIPVGVTSIGDRAFSGCSSLTNIKIPDDVTSIGVSSFATCAALRNIKIPDGVTSIGNNAFSGCSSLTNIKIPDGVTSIGNNAFSGCSSLTNIKIPDGVTSIGDEAFNHCSVLIDITIPDSVISIGDSAFNQCYALTNINIPDSVTSIGDEAFHLCSSLTDITIPDSVTSIGRSTFASCSSLKNVNIPDGVTSIGKYAFFDCSSLTNINIPDGVTSIAVAAFGGCDALTSIAIPDSVTSIGSWAFSDCSSLTSITIPDSVTSIDDYTFKGCTALTSIAIPDSVTSIGIRAFSDCSSLTSITIPDSVTSIDDVAFALCTSLRSIAIPSNVTDIGNDAFWRCPSYLLFQVERNSYAAQYCQDNNLQYVYTDEQPGT